MKSIRLSLVAYFLLLLSAALGAVSWLVYQTTARTLREKEQSTAKLVEANCTADIKTAKEAFNQLLLAKAKEIAVLTKEPSQHLEFFYPFGMLAAGTDAIRLFAAAALGGRGNKPGHGLLAYRSNQ